MPPPPYSSQHDQSVPATQFSHSPVFLSSSSVLLNNKHTQFVHGPSVYYNSGPHDRFGFNPSAPIVPPGTEPDLQALNNPYIVVARASKSNPVSSHVPFYFGSQSSNQAGPDIHTNPTTPVIDPALEAISKTAGKHPFMGRDTFEDIGEGRTDDDREDNSGQSDENEEEAHNHHHSVPQSKFKVLTSLLLNKGSRISVP